MASGCTLCKACNARDGPWHHLSTDVCPLCECDPHFFEEPPEAAAPKQSASAKRNGVTFDFESKPEEYSPLYLAEPSRFTASTNAGDYRLYVGGGAINGAFLRLLKQEQGLKCGRCSEDYAELHSRLLKESRRTGTLIAAADVPGAQHLLDKLGLAASFGQAGVVLQGDCAGFEGCNGSVFIDVFEPRARPLHEKNAAMLYVVGPKGEGCSGPKGEDSGPLLSKAEFLDTVKALGRRALEAVARYNCTAGHGRLPRIEEVRWCLVSGGVYRHAEALKADVARATLDGMSSAACEDLRVTFTYDEDCFLRAYEGSEAAGAVAGSKEVSGKWTGAADRGAVIKEEPSTAGHAGREGERSNAAGAVTGSREISGKWTGAADRGAVIQKAWSGRRTLLVLCGLVVLRSLFLLWRRRSRYK